MDFLNFVTAARTCRRFKEDQTLTIADLDWLINCARVVPSARNGQNVKFVEVVGQKVYDIFPKTHWAMALKDWGGPKEGERPTAFIGLAIPKDAQPITLIDVGIVAQTIQLAAHSKDFGCCIIKSFDLADVSKSLEIPAELKLELLLGLGVALEVRKVAEVPESGSLNYFRDANGVHYVPKKPLADLIIKRFSD